MNYNRLTDNTEKKAFSLAEALITLLIICIVVALTVNSMSKSSKFKKQSLDSNYWFCYLNNTGQYMVGGSGESGGVPPNTGSAETDHCVFKPPKGISQFYVTAIGGGGGGSAGSSSSVKAETRDGISRFIPPVTGPYSVIVIGAGGGGGGSNCGSDPAQGGGAGGVIHNTLTLKQGVTYTLFAGKGGSGGKSAKTGAKGDDSYIESSDLPRETARGGNGGYGKYHAPIFKCKKGYGDGKGGGCTHSNCAHGGDAPGGDVPGPGRVCKFGTSGCVVPDLPAKLGLTLDDIVDKIGNGGMGAYNDHGGGEGSPGLVKIVYSPIFSGWGGKSGMQSYYIYKRNPGETKVVVGGGGKGGIKDNEPGTQGGTSRFGERVIAQGGPGGEPKYKNASLDAASPLVEGGEGGGSVAPHDLSRYGFDFTGVPYGGLQSPNFELKGLKVNAPGSGGGGGGANASGFGAGGDGSSGIVIVSW